MAESHAVYLERVGLESYTGILTRNQLDSLGTQRTHESGALFASGLAAALSLAAAMVKTVDTPAGITSERQEVQKGAVRMLAMRSEGQHVGISHRSMLLQALCAAGVPQSTHFLDQYRARRVRLVTFATSRQLPLILERDASRLAY